MPLVTVPCRPRGAPMAMTGCPTESVAESPVTAGVRPLAPLACTTARSVTGSRPTIVPSYDVPSCSTTLIAPPPAAAATTWLFVRISPFADRTTPLPSSAPLLPWTCSRTTLGVTAFATRSTSVPGLPAATGAAALEAPPPDVADEVGEVPDTATTAAAETPPPTRPATRPTVATVTRERRGRDRCPPVLSWCCSGSGSTGPSYSVFILPSVCRLAESSLSRRGPHQKNQHR